MGLIRFSESGLILVGAAHLHRIELQAELPRRLLTLLPLRHGAWSLRIPQDSDLGELGNGFFEECEPFAG